MAFCMAYIFLMPSAPAAGQAAIKVAVAGTCPPLEMKNGRGQVTGFEVDLIKAVAKESGLKVTIVERPWRKLLSELDKATVDAVAAQVLITDSKRERYDFTEPYLVVRQLLVVGIRNTEEPLEGKAVATFRLSPTSEALRLYQRCPLTFYTADETEQAFRDLSHGWVQAVLCDSPLARHYAMHMARYKGMFAVKEPPSYQGCPANAGEYGIAVRKGNKKILDLLNRGLKAVQVKGIDKVLMDKWKVDADLPGCPGNLAEVRPASSQQETP